MIAKSLVDKTNQLKKFNPHAHYLEFAGET
jgi:hypothetical protein